MDGPCYDDLDTHQEALDLQLAGFEQTRQQGYADAQAAHNDAVELAWQSQVIAYAKAGQARDESDAAAIQSMPTKTARPKNSWVNSSLAAGLRCVF